MMNVKKSFIQTLALTIALLGSLPANAGDYEITPMVGQMFSSDLEGITSGDATSVSDDSHIGFAFAWQDSPNGQGQILINSVSHDFESELDQQTHSLDIFYAHFSGVAQFRQQNYVTTVSIGLGGAYFDAEGGEDVYPSLTAAVGTRYEISNNIAIVTELRTYASLTDEDSDLFCKGDSCSAAFEGAVWIDTAISVGVAYKF